jgi:hypothetical protein
MLSSCGVDFGIELDSGQTKQTLKLLFAAFEH